MKKYSVITAPSTVKLLNLLKSTLPALILLDIDMPETDGYETIKILKSKAETESIPVIFLIDAAGSLEEERWRTLGAVDYIAKPFNTETLITSIENTLGPA